MYSTLVTIAMASQLRWFRSRSFLSREGLGRQVRAVSSAAASSAAHVPAGAAAASSPSASAAASKLFSRTAVNFHFTRKCNYSCKFCFHTAKSSDVLDKDDCFSLLREIREAGAPKINFAGGEPFLPGYHSLLGEMVRYCKEELKYDSVSIISNGSHISEQWFQQYGQHLDILGISIDTMDPVLAFRTGRWRAGARAPEAGDAKAGGQVGHVRQAAALAAEYKVKLKVNTVVTSVNVADDLTPLINEVRPMRWKIFQVLPIEGENCGPDASAKQDVTPLLVSKEQFDEYVDRARERAFNPSIIKNEDNATMASSYVLVDEKGRLLDSSTGGKVPTRPILEVGLEEAAAELLASRGGGFDRGSYIRRDGDYPDQWSRSHPGPPGVGAGASGVC